MSVLQQRVEQLVDHSRLGALQIRVVVLCSCVCLLDGYDLQTMGFLVPTLSGAWGLAAADFRLALSASLIGLAAGAFVAGPLSDRFGRRRVLLGALLLLALSTLACAMAGEVQTLTLWRLATGLGLGASLPNVIAMTAEYAPLRQRALLLSLMLCGLPLGGALGGQLAAEMIGPLGWQSLFIVGGSIPLLLLVSMFIWLPESIKFLATRRDREQELQRILAQLELTPAIAAEMPSGQSAVDSHADSHAGAVAGLFSEQRAIGTVLLWCIFLLNLFLLYVLNSWLPTMLKSTGWSIESALRGAAMFHYGGLLGGLLMSRLADRYGPYRIMPPIYVLTFVAVAAIGPASGNAALAFLVMALAGAGIIGAQFCLNALAAAFYPTLIRATGLGWAHGMGRLGAILSPFLGSILIAAALGIDGFFLVAALPALLCAVSVLVMRVFAARVQATA